MGEWPGVDAAPRMTAGVVVAMTWGWCGGVVVMRKR